MLLNDDRIFAAAFENADFKKLFFEKLRSMEKVFCNPGEAVEKLNKITTDSKKDMLLWYERFYSGTDGETYYDEKVQDIKDYFEKRPAAIERLIEKYNGIKE